MSGDEHLWALYEETHGQDQRRYPCPSLCDCCEEADPDEEPTVQCEVCGGEGCPVCDHTGRVTP